MYATVTEHASHQFTSSIIGHSSVLSRFLKVIARHHRIINYFYFCFAVGRSHFVTLLLVAMVAVVVVVVVVAVEVDIACVIV